MWLKQHNAIAFFFLCEAPKGSSHFIMVAHHTQFNLQLASAIQHVIHFLQTRQHLT